MIANALIDTSAILALLDSTDRWHDSCVGAFQQLRLPLLTSEAVLTELFHLVGDTRSEMEAAWRFVRSGALVLSTIEHAKLQHVHGLTSRYWDRPMDFAAGTLVYLARREFLSVILTVDHADFATYCIVGKRQFRLLPGRSPVKAKTAEYSDSPSTIVCACFERRVSCSAHAFAHRAICYPHAL
jgi:predicted nucleic acid-binding protein